MEYTVTEAAGSAPAVDGPGPLHAAGGRPLSVRTCVCSGRGVRRAVKGTVYSCGGFNSWVRRSEVMRVKVRRSEAPHRCWWQATERARMRVLCLVAGSGGP